ncbi:MAG: RNA polymerase sigma factor [Planctomycetes bacterium]|nr:RNA polymerase sigma factor [Planctomycetota bacterium]MCW8134252.1 RNA polymerase sigma factor [Planctomycetota bacterium]
MAFREWMLVASLDRRAVFERIIRDHQAGVWRYLRFLGCSTAEADDLTQETFLAAWKSDFDEINDAATAGFLRTVAKSRFLMAVRTKGRRIMEAELDVEADWVQLTNDGTGWDEGVVALEQCLQHVSGKAATVLDMVYRDELTQTEVAAKLDMKPEGVRTLLKRVLAKLRECMEGKLDWPTSAKND